MKTVSVIGSGIAGIAAAIRLRLKNYDVTIYEKNDKPGGKIYEFEINGFRFDTGPSLFTMPGLIDELFDEVGQQHTLQYSPLDVVCRYHFANGKVVDSYTDVEKFAAEMNEKLGEPRANIHACLHHSRKIYDLTADVFLFDTIHKFRSYLKPKFLKSMLRIGRLDPFKTMHQRNTALLTSPEAVQLFDRYATYNGSNPYVAPATLNVISHIEHNMGAFFPDKGMYSIVDELVKLATKLGVKFSYNAQVDLLLTRDNRVTHAVVNGQQIPCDGVVSDMDIRKFYTHVLQKKMKGTKYLNDDLSTSALIFYWGMNKSFPQLQLHNIFFAENYKAEFDSLFQTKTLYNDPTIYVFISSKHVKTDAPDGCENWFVMVNAPSVGNKLTQTQIAEMRETILQKLSLALGENIEEYIGCEKMATPESIEFTSGAFQGALYGNSSNSMFAAFNRHPNFSPDFKNLYFVGGSVHPGGGIPLCLASAKIVDSIFDV